MAHPAAAPHSPAAFTEFGRLLKHLRRRARLTQVQLAAAVGYTGAHICRLENGQRQPEIAALAALFVPALGLEAEPQWAAHLLALGQAMRAGDHSEAPLAEALEAIPAARPEHVPRPVELARLIAQLKREGRVALCGLPGVGKTTLAAQAVREWPAPPAVFWLTLTPGITDSAEALLRALALFLWRQGEVQARPWLTPATPPQALDQQLAVLRAGLARRPALVCVDNAQHLSAEALVVVQHLLATTTAGFLFISRVDLPLVGVANVRLGGLRLEEGRRLLAHPAHAELHGWLGDHGAQLLEKVDGNPMLLRLALGALNRNASLTFLEALGQQPQIAAFLLTSSLAGLSADARHLLELLSVFRRPVDALAADFGELGHGAPTPFDIPAALDEVQRRYHLDDPCHAVLPPVLQEHLYSRLAMDTRRRLHRLAARWWEPRDEIEAAHHLAQGHQWAAAVDGVTRQIEAVIRRGQALAAVAVLEAVLRQSRGQPRQRDLTRRALIARAYLLTGTLRAAEAEADYRAALALTRAPALRASLIQEAAPLWVQRGKPEEALALIESALAALTPAEAVLAAQLAAWQGQLLYRLSQPSAAVAAAQRALAVCDTQRALILPAVEGARARAHLALGNVRRLEGDYAAALQHRRAARRAAAQAGLLRLACASLDAIGTVYFDLGDLAGAWRDREGALALAREIGSHYHEAYILVHLAEVHWARGELDAAGEKLDAGRALLTAIGETPGLASADTLRAAVLVARGRLAQAHTLLEALLADRLAHHADPFLSHYLGGWARVQLLYRQTEPAQATLAQALHQLGPAGASTQRAEVLHLQALAAVTANDLPHARRVLALAAAQPADLWTQLERSLTGAVVAAAGGDQAQAHGLAAAVAAHAAQTGFVLLQRRALRLRAHLPQLPDLPDLPQVLWVDA